MRAADIVAAGVALVLAAAMLLGASRLDYWLEFAPGPGFFPLWIALGGLAGSCALLAGALARGQSEPLDWPDRAGALRVVATACALVLIVAVVDHVGFVTAALAFMLFVLLALCRRRLVPSLVATVVTVGVVYGVFGRWLHVPLPVGPFGF